MIIMFVLLGLIAWTVVGFVVALSVGRVISTSSHRQLQEFVAHMSTPSRAMPTGSSTKVRVVDPATTVDATRSQLVGAPH